VAKLFLKDVSLQDSLQHFDLLPEAAHVRQPVVQALFGFSGSTLRRRMADGKIPKPRRYSCRVVAWNVGELRRVLQADGQGQSEAPGGR
jgi:predicted DNA-binding transcriptional regulator AlpA